MKKFVICLFCVFISPMVKAATETINWYVDGNTYATTTCQTGGDITLPPAPTKYGYTFQGWTLEYVFLEYIESTGTQYIDTGVVPTLGFQVKTKIAFTSTVGNNGILGEAWVANSPLLIGMGGGSLRWHLATGPGIDVPSTTATDNYTEFSVEAANGYIKINDTLYTGTPLSSFSTTNKIRLFSQGIYHTSIRMYSIAIWDNDTKLFNGIPAKRRGDNAIGMYDTVTGTFFTNAGTGEFIAGPVINQ